MNAVHTETKRATCWLQRTCLASFAQSGVGFGV
jgi:hypothetical protein